MILARNVQPSIMISTPPVSAGVNAIVAGAGTTAVNGTYTPRGELNGKPYYNLVGEPDDPILLAISWDGTYWNIYDDIGDGVYGDNSPTTYPWEVAVWLVTNGSEPAPTVTQG